MWFALGVSGGDDTEQRRFGDWLTHDERYALTPVPGARADAESHNVGPICAILRLLGLPRRLMRPIHTGDRVLESIRLASQ